MGITINSKYLPALSRVFTPVVMDSLVYNGTSGYLKEVILNSSLINQLDTSMTLKNFFDWIYDILFQNYRNEYIYKNAIANKILLGKHSLNTSHMLTEFRVANCKADIVILNGTSSVYEIKSEYDSFLRLENQIKAYVKIFDHVNVITSNSQLTKLKRFLPKAIGIMILTNRNTIKTIRNSESHLNNLDVEIIFDSLRKYEYTAIIKECFGEIPDLPNTLIYKECKRLFCTLPVEKIHYLMIKNLRKRSDTKILKEFVERAPSSLIAYAFSGSAAKKKILRLTSLFDKPIESILMPTNS